MTTTTTPGHFGSHSPKHVYGRLNLDYVDSERAQLPIIECSEQAADDFTFDNTPTIDEGLKEYQELFGGGKGSVFDDNGWNIAGFDPDDAELIGVESLSDIKEDLDPTVEGSTAWLVAHSEKPWEKYDAIVSSAHFFNINHSVVEHRKHYDAHNQEFKDKCKLLDKAVDDGIELEDAASIYAEAQQALSHHEAYANLKQVREEYLNMIANSVNGVAQADVDAMEVDDSQLGITESNLVSVGYAETGTRKWLEMRQDSLGGSDMGALADKSWFATQNKERVWESKVADISDEEVSDQMEKQGYATDAPSRGNAMEDVIGALYAHHTGKNIVHNKSTWKTLDGNQHINFDFAEQDSNGHYLGPVEIKNVNDGSKWGSPEDGLDGVPVTYRSQVLQQAYHSNASKATVVAMMAGGTMKAYTTPMTPQLRAEAEEFAATAAPYMDKVRQARQEYKKTGVVPPSPDSQKNFTYRKGIPKNATSTKKISGEKARLMSRMATLGSTTKEDIAQRFVDALGTTDTKQWTPEKQQTAFKQVYRSLQPSGSFNGIDLETNAMSPTQGNIIEFGGVTYDMDKGQESHRFGSLYKPTDNSMSYNKTGMVDVHNIDEDMVADKGHFSALQNQKDILGYLTGNGPIVAHNANFEKSWLRAHVEGFAEAESRGDIKFVDTMDITKHVVPTDANTLKSFVNYHGVSEEEYNRRAHRATDDTEMMMESLVKWSRNNSM